MVIGRFVRPFKIISRDLEFLDLLRIIALYTEYDLIKKTWP